MADFKHPNHGVKESSLAVQASWMFFHIDGIQVGYVSLLWRVGGLWLRRLETQDTTEQTCHWMVQEGTIVLSCCAFRFLNNFSLLVLIMISLFVIPLDRMRPRNVFLHFFS